MTTTRRRFLGYAESLPFAACATSGGSAPPRLAASTTCEIGENPLWHPDRKTVFFLDIAPGVVHAYDPSTGSHREFSRGPVTGGMLIQGSSRPVTTSPPPRAAEDCTRFASKACGAGRSSGLACVSDGPRLE